jgi:hypothetical protein
MRIRAFSTLVGAGLFALALSMSSAQAGTILVFGQNGTSNQFTATNDGSTGVAGGTTLSAVDIPVTITGMDNAVLLPAGDPQAYFSLGAASVSNATVDSSGQITQDFSGWFSVTSLAGGGANYLSGTFADAIFGSGAGLVLTASGPTGVPTFSSNVISALGQMRAISLSFTNVTPPALVTSDQTLGGFTSSVSGNFSGASVPEPASLVLLGLGMTWLLVFRRGRRRTVVS